MKEEIAIIAAFFFGEIGGIEGKDKRVEHPSKGSRRALHFAHNNYNNKQRPDMIAFERKRSMRERRGVVYARMLVDGQMDGNKKRLKRGRQFQFIAIA